MLSCLRIFKNETYSDSSCLCVQWRHFDWRLLNYLGHFILYVITEEGDLGACSSQRCSEMAHCSGEIRSLCGFFKIIYKPP